MKNTERRNATRVSTLSGNHLPVEIRANQNQSLQATLLNLSRYGALLELDRRQSSHLRVDERVSVKLRLPQDIVWVAGVVRHCSASRLGVFFPAGVGTVLSKAKLFPPKTIQQVKYHRAPQAVLQSL